MKAPWKISLPFYSNTYTFYIGSRYIHLYNADRRRRKKYLLTDEWKLALTSFSQQENMSNYGSHILTVILDMFQCIDRFGKFSPADYFNEDELEMARQTIDDYKRIHDKELAASLKYRQKHGIEKGRVEYEACTRNKREMVP